MRICILTTSFPRNRDDFVGQWIFGLSRALVELGLHVRVIAPHDKDTPAHEHYDGVEVHRFSYWLPKSTHGLCYGAGIPTNIHQHPWLALQSPLLEACFLQAALRYGRDVDIFNAHWSIASLPSIIAGRLLNKPTVVHAYSAEFVHKAMKPINRFIIRNSAAIISISHYTKSIVEKSLTPREHHVIRLGVNREKIAPADFNTVAFRKSKGIGDHDKLIFSVGRLIERKGYHVLIDAISLLAGQNKQCFLLLAGEGPQRKELEERIHKHGIEARARLIGFVPDEELSCYMKACDVLVAPAIFDQRGDTEGLGLTLLEAMANGTPVIASNVGGISDIVQHEETGLLVKPYDHSSLAHGINRLLSDTALRTKVVAAGYHLTNGPFSWGTIAQQTIDVFNNALTYKIYRGQTTKQRR